MCDDVLAGTVSVGNKCALPDFPGVYARIPKYVEWIEFVTDE